MLLAGSGFVTICPKKEVELGADRHLHRADHAEELRQEIAFDCPKATGNQYAYLPGGAVRAINPNSSMTLAETENLIAVFKGNLFNKSELALRVLNCPASTPEAQLLLQLYAAKGLDMLGMLKGQYAFCLYDSKQARVLAARDHSGAVPLLEGRTAAGSLIIACGTFLPEGVTHMTDIQPGEYKYGWHALPRAFKCGETKIVAGRASCDYGIRRRSIDAYNAPPRRSIDLPRHNSMDIPRQHSGHYAAPTSYSYSHTPGRYMPPHAAAAAAAAATGSGGFTIRQRAMSLDGSHTHNYSRQHGTPPTAGGRRRSETTTHSHKQQNQQHQWVPKAPMATADSAASPAAKAPAVPPLLQTPFAGEAHHAEMDEVATPVSAASTPSTQSSMGTQSSLGTPRRRRRRHHRRGRGHSAATEATAAAADAQDGHDSEADSQVSSCTHDSANSGPGAQQQQTAARRASRDGSSQPKPQQKQPAKQQQQQQQQQQPSVSGTGGFKRTGSCSELAVLGTSPTHSMLVAAPQGLAC